MRLIILGFAVAALQGSFGPQLDATRTQTALMIELGVLPPGEPWGRRRGGDRP